MTATALDAALTPGPLRGDVAIVGMACTFPGARNVVEFLPPLTVAEAEIDRAVDVFAASVARAEAGS